MLGDGWPGDQSDLAGERTERVPRGPGRTPGMHLAQRGQGVTSSLPFPEHPDRTVRRADDPGGNEGLGSLLESLQRDLQVLLLPVAAVCADVTGHLVRVREGKSVQPAEQEEAAGQQEVRERSPYSAWSWTRPSAMTLFLYVRSMLLRNSGSINGSKTFRNRLIVSSSGEDPSAAALIARSSITTGDAVAPAFGWRPAFPDALGDDDQVVG